MNRDLTEGEAEKVLWRFCLPLLGSIVFQQLYNIADSFVVGKFVGEDALAAVGNSYEVTLIFIAFAFGCNIGCSVVVARLFGTKEYGQMKTAVYTALIATGVLCVALMLFGVFGCGWLLRLINTPEKVYADSMLYLDIYIWGLPFLFFYNVATGIFSAMGDSRTPLYFLAFSSLTNIAVDVLFVKAFDMGVGGVAWATFLCQGVSCVLAVMVMLRRLKGIPAQGKAAVFSGRMLGRIAVIAVPSILQQSFVSVGNIIIQGVINGFGPSVMAGYSAAVKLNNLVITSLTTLGNGISSFTSQNIGAGRLYRVKEGFRAGVKLVWVVCAPLVAVYWLGARYLVYLFMEDMAGVAIDTGVEFLRIVSPFYFMISVKLVADGTLRGAGLMGRFMAATFMDLILRVVLAIALAAPFGPAGVWWSWPVGWFVGVVMSVFFYRRGPWKGKAA